MRRTATTVLLLALAVPAAAGAPPGAPPAVPGIEADCLRLVAECQAARAAAQREGNSVEYPPGVVWKRSSPGAQRHVVQAIAIAREMQQRYGALPSCARACDDLLTVP